MLTVEDLLVAAKAAENWPEGVEGNLYLSQVPEGYTLDDAKRELEALRIVEEHPEYLQFA